MRKETLASVAVVVGAVMFGFLGICARYFQNDVGLTAIDTVIVRLSFGSIFILIILGVWARRRLNIRKRDLPYLLLFGFFKIMSDVTFFYAQNTTTLSLATLLQMTAPYYVMVISLVLFRDRITIEKMLALFVASVGCVIVTGMISGEGVGEISGILSALASGFFFGMFTIGSKMSVDRNMNPATYLFYSMLFANLFALPFTDIGNVVDAVSNPEGFAMGFILGVFLTLIPFYLYAWSSIYLEPTKVSMISILEVVSATLVGFMFFDESLAVLDMIGIVLVCSAVVIMNIKLRQDIGKREARLQDASSN